MNLLIYLATSKIYTHNNTIAITIYLFIVWQYKLLISIVK